MEGCNFESIIQYVETDCNHDLLLMMSNMYKRLNQPSISKEDTMYIYEQIQSMLSYFTDKKTTQLSHQIKTMLAENLCMIFHTDGPMLLDTVSLCAGFLADENLSKKKYNYSAIKDTAVYILDRTYREFGSDLTTQYAPIAQSIFRNLKKANEASVFQANWATQLLKLFHTMLSNGCKPYIDEYIIGKFTKLAKQTLSKVDKYPVDYVEVVLKTWPFFYTNNKYFSSKDLVGHFKSKASGTLILGLGDDSFRTTCAESIAEVMIYFNETVPLQNILQLYVDLFVNNALPTKVGVMESLVHFVSRQDPWLNEHYTEVLTFVIEEILKSPKVLEAPMDQVSRYIQLFVVFHQEVRKLMGESTKKMLFGKIQERLLEDATYIQLTYLQLLNTLLDELSSSVEKEQLKGTLYTLATGNNFPVRVHSIETLKKLCVHFPDLMPYYIDKAMHVLTEEFKLPDEVFQFNKVHGNALIIANLAEIADKDHVSYSEVMKAMVFANGFLKTTSSRPSYHKTLISWILLTGLMNYKYEGVSVHSLFLFWKNLLTPTYVYTSEDALYQHLEIRNHALACLVSFLNNTTIDADLAKQVSTLLNKCSNFNHSIPISSSKIDSALLQNENRLLQIYLLIIDYIKEDFNSSVLILIVKNFADESVYADSKTHTNKVLPRNLFNVEDGFAFGVSSKILLGARNAFEKELASPIVPVLSYDYFTMLFGYKISPKVTTSIVDSSIEIFSQVFPHLTTKIQQSIMETMRSLILSKTTFSYRTLAIVLNSCFALNKAMKVAHDKKQTLDQEIFDLISTTLEKIDIVDNEYLVRLNSDTFGLLVSNCTVPDKAEFIQQQHDVCVSKIVNNEEPYARVYNAMNMAALYCYTGSHMVEIMSVLETLIADPHPVVHTWSLKSLAKLLENYTGVMSAKTANETLDLLEKVFCDDAYGKYGDSVIRSSYNSKFSSYEVIADILASLVLIMGPNIDLCDEDIFQAMIFLNLLGSTEQQRVIFGALEELFIFKSKMYHEVIVRKQLKNALVESLPRGDELFDTVVQFYSQLLKLSDFSAQADIEYYMWVALELYPNKNSLYKFVSTFHAGFSKLLVLSETSRGTLFGKFRPIRSDNSDKKQNDVDDEEESAIAVKKDEFNEPLNWRFKLLILEMIREQLQVSHQVSAESLVKISFTASTSSIVALRLIGLDILSDVIRIFGPMKDPQFEESSILEQQQAQITSALTPAFNADSCPEVASKAVTVAAEFIGSEIVSYTKLERIFKILITSLQNDVVRVGDVSIPTKDSQKKLKLSILNAWAELKIKANEELDEAIAQYNEILIPLWIISLREFSIIKYGSETVGDVKDYDAVWLNFVEVIGLVELDMLSTEDLDKFLFVLYAQCFESLIKNPDMRVLEVMSKLLAHKSLALAVLFDDNIFTESLDLFNRLIIVGNEQDRLQIMEIVLQIAKAYQTKELSEEIEKIFEIIRVFMLCVTEYLPFLRSSEAMSAANISHTVVRASFDSILIVAQQLPDVIQDDIFSSLLYIIGEIYSNGNNELIPVVLPVLKSVKDKTLLHKFYNQFNSHFDKLNSDNKVATYMVLAEWINSDDIVDLLCYGVEQDSPLTQQAIKSLISNHSRHLRLLIPRLIQLAPQHDAVAVLLLQFTKEYLAAMKIMIPVFASLEHNARARMLELIQLDSDSFKSCLADLSVEQVEKVESLVKK